MMWQLHHDKCIFNNAKEFYFIFCSLQFSFAVVCSESNRKMKKKKKKQRYIFDMKNKQSNNTRVHAQHLTELKLNSDVYVSSWINFYSLLLSACLDRPQKKKSHINSLRLHVSRSLCLCQLSIISFILHVSIEFNSIRRQFFHEFVRLQDQTLFIPLSLVFAWLLNRHSIQASPSSSLAKMTRQINSIKIQNVNLIERNARASDSLVAAEGSLFMLCEHKYTTEHPTKVKQNIFLCSSLPLWRGFFLFVALRHFHFESNYSISTESSQIQK